MTKRSMLTIWLWRAQAAGAALCFLTALLVSPPVAERLFIRDHVINDVRPFLALDVILLIPAVWLLVRAIRNRGREIRFNPRTALLASITLAITLVVLVVAAEIGVRVLMDPAKLLREDAWWEYHWRAAHAAQPSAADEAALTHEKYGFDEYDPGLGWRPRADYASESVRTNAMGIRADREYETTRRDGVRRVVVVGDSYTWGEEVGNADTYSSRLEELLPATDVINLGVHGYGTDQQLLYLRERGFDFAPDLVVLAIYDDNINRNALAFRDYAKPRFELRGGELNLTGVPVPSPDEILASKQRLPRSYLWQLARAAWQDTISRTVFYDLEKSERWQVTSAILAAARRETEAREMSFLLVLVPWTVRHEPMPFEPAIVAWAVQNDVDFLNLRESFLTLDESEWPLLYRGHLTPLGNERTAEFIAAQIMESDLLPEASR